MSDLFRGKLKFPLVALMTGVIAVACSDDSTGPGGNEPPEDNVVELLGDSFSPADLTIDVGETVEWRNTSGIPHTVTSNDNEWTEKSVPADDEWTGSETFNEAGSYDYNCQLHANMTGTITVVE